MGIIVLVTIMTEWIDNYIKHKQLISSSLKVSCKFSVTEEGYKDC